MNVKKEYKIFKILALMVLCAVSVSLVLTNLKSIEVPNSKLKEQQSHLVMRSIGHDLLNSLGNESEVIPPVQKIDSFTYRLKFNSPIIINPDTLVIGVDKSASRIERNVEGFDLKNGYQASNYHLVRADLNDFYRLVKAANWPVSKHYILYPNPWPKSKHLQRRWHGSAVFPFILSVGQELILRSNWRLYLEEFQFAAELAKQAGSLEEVTHLAKRSPLTPFEAKYTQTILVYPLNNDKKLSLRLISQKFNKK